MSELYRGTFLQKGLTLISAASQIIYHISNGAKIVSSCKCKLKIIKVVNTYNIFFLFSLCSISIRHYKIKKKTFSNSCFRYVFLFQDTFIFLSVFPCDLTLLVIHPGFLSIFASYAMFFFLYMLARYTSVFVSVS